MIATAAVGLTIASPALAWNGSPFKGGYNVKSEVVQSDLGRTGDRHKYSYRFHPSEFRYAGFLYWIGLDNVQGPVSLNKDKGSRTVYRGLAFYGDVTCNGVKQRLVVRITLRITEQQNGIATKFKGRTHYSADCGSETEALRGKRH